MATATLIVTVLAMLIAGALVVLTATLHRTTLGAATSVESIRLVEEIQLDLLHHERAHDVLVKRELESDLRRRLIEARQFVATQQEADVLAEAESRVDVYLAAARKPFGPDAPTKPSPNGAERLAAQEAAYVALRDLTTINVNQAQTAQREAASWDRLANAIATGAIVLLLLVSGSLLAWLKRRAFEPVIELAATMERFAAGDHDARATEHGPRELREMCRRFNEMASIIAAQRHAQLAFLGGVAHDLRNPLSALQMSVFLLLADPSLGTDARIRSAIERISRQIKRMDRMVGDFLDGAKIEAGQLELRVEVHDARALVEEVVELFDGMSTKHQLEVQVPAHVVPIYCDQLRIEQVLTNLISNAIKYSPSGGVVEVVLRSGASELEFSVTDQGVGIPPASIPSLFAPFRRLGLSTEGVPGVGLGLFVVRRIVEAHRGRIEVESASGVGSTFRVFLPLEYEGS